jgi:serine/threonine protein kinase
VKKLEENSLVTRDKQFKNEVESLMEIRHENIVKLVAFCHETRKEVLQKNGRLLLQDITQALLCYEYLPMGSLDKYIFGKMLNAPSDILHVLSLFWFMLLL